MVWVAEPILTCLRRREYRRYPLSLQPVPPLGTAAQISPFCIAELPRVKAAVVVNKADPALGPCLDALPACALRLNPSGAVPSPERTARGAGPGPAMLRP